MSSLPSGPSRTLRLKLSISSDQYLAWYRGTARSVIAQSDDGKTVEFPAALLQRFVTPHGIQGTFLLTIDASNRFLHIEREPGASLG